MIVRYDVYGSMDCQVFKGGEKTKTRNIIRLRILENTCQIQRKTLSKLRQQQVPNENLLTN